MKTNKSMYLFAAALVAGTMGMTSCSNDEMDENLTKGKTTNIALGMSVALPVQTKAPTSPNDVNFGDEIADIQNVTIVPMVGTSVQSPIVLGKFDADVKTTHYKAASVLETVDGFRVYGNLPTAPSESAIFVMPSLAQEDSEDNNDTNVTGLKKPHALYFYTESNKKTNKFQVAKGSVAGDWESASFKDIEEQDKLSDYNRIKIPGVTYAVGVFSAATLDEVADVEGNAALTKNIFSEDGQTATKSWETVKGEGKTINITGLVIEGQSADFDATFAPEGGEVKVFAASTEATLATTAIKFDETTNKVTGANIYSVVAPEDAKSITINFQFQNNTGYTLHLNNGETAANGEYFYLPAVLDQGNMGEKIFDAATSTLINARVKDWGKGVKAPVETVDAEIGIVIDTQWKKGIAFDEEI